MRVSRETLVSCRRLRHPPTAIEWFSMMGRLGIGETGTTRLMALRQIRPDRKRQPPEGSLRRGPPEPVTPLMSQTPRSAAAPGERLADHFLLRRRHASPPFTPPGERPAVFAPPPL